MEFKNKCTALGRNGRSYCVGLSLYLYSRINSDNQPFSVVEISPINTYGDVTRCYIEVEAEAIPELIKQLQFFYDQSTRNTRL